MTEIQYTVIRSSRKTISIQITPGGDVLVRCPNRMRAEDIRRFVESKGCWIEKHLSKMESQSALPTFTREEIHGFAQAALRVTPERVAHFAPIIGVDYGRVTIRCQRSRWGSCSSRGNLNFNCLLVLVPNEVLDYVVVHELCHRKELNHSPRFWAEVEKVLPDYRAQRAWLKEHGGALIGRIE